MPTITVHSTNGTHGALALIQALKEAKQKQAEEFPIHHHEDGLVTISLFWDCECKTRYIHNRALQSSCLRCFARAEDQPDSRLEEVARYGLLVSTPIGISVPDGVRCAYFLEDTMQDKDGNYIPLIAAENIYGNFATTWKFGKDKRTAEKMVEELNASLGLSLKDSFDIRLSTIRF